LYSREYFSLMRARLAEGGIATYWLPVLLFEPREAFAVVRGFCDVFDDCSLWTGFGHQWMLVGTRSAHASAGAARFAAQWDDPLVAARLGAAGLASPAQLGATFLADAAQLGALTPDVPPLVDDRPYRLDPRRQVGHPAPEYAALMETTGARRRFQESAFVRRLWPAQWIDRTLDAFARQAVLNRHAWRSELVIPQSDMADLAAALTAGDETLALWMLGSSVEEQELAARAQAEGFEGPELRETRGLGALAARRFAQAETMLAAAEPQSVHAARLRRWRILAAALANDRENAARLLRSAGALVRASASDEEREAWSWLSRQVGLALPAS
jgi:hypothetical protein